MTNRPESKGTEFSLSRRSDRAVTFKGELLPVLAVFVLVDQRELLNLWSSKEVALNLHPMFQLRSVVHDTAELSIVRALQLEAK